MSPDSARPAVILDRDGTLCREQGFVCTPTELVLLPGVPTALRRLAAAGFRRIVVTNQSGIARGLYTEAQLARIHDHLQEQCGGLIDGFLHCPHHPEEGIAASGYAAACDCRKPRAGLLVQAAGLFALDWTRSFLVGDSARDLAMGQDLPARRVLVRSGKPWQAQVEKLRATGCTVDHVADELGAAVDWILDRIAQGR